jgi:NADPH-dependent curcumin reductase CurA
MSTYKRLVAVRHSKNFREAVEIQDTEFRPLNEKEVLIKVHYSGVNAADYMMAAGQYLIPTPPPYPLGAEVIGEIVEIGAKQKNDLHRVGSRVLAIASDGGYGEYAYARSMSSQYLYEVTPDYMAIGISGLTASIALDVPAQMRTKETVFINAAAGATGHIAVQLAVRTGNRVIATCGTDEKAAWLTELGVHRVINYRTEDLDAVLKAEFPKGINIVLDSVGGPMFDIVVRHLAYRGRIINIGFIDEYTAGAQAISQPRIYTQLLRRSTSIHGFWLMSYFDDYHISHWQKLMTLIRTNNLKPHADPRRFMGLEQVADAVEYLYSGQSMGKVIVRYQEEDPIRIDPNTHQPPPLPRGMGGSNEGDGDDHDISEVRDPDNAGE